jgi:hypothetical protein
LKTIVKPFWTADSLWLSDWEKREIAGSKWYKTFPGICGKIIILLFPAECIYKFCTDDLVGGVVYLFGAIAWAYIAALVRKFRSQDDASINPKTQHPTSADSAADAKLERKLKLLMIVIIPYGFVILLGPMVLMSHGHFVAAVLLFASPWIVLRVLKVWSRRRK